MADSFEEIAVQQSIVRQQWLPLDVAVQELITFQQLYGEGHFLLACHAALPSLLTPELLHAIRLNFLDQSQPRPPWIAEMDLLLSPLCRPLERDLFEVEPRVREAALFKLEELYGWQRLQDVADFLAQYQQKNANRKLNAGAKQLHTWIAQAYLQPDEVIRELTHLLTASVDTHSSDYETLPKKLRIARTMELLADPLRHATLRADYDDLVHSARVLAHVLYSNRETFPAKTRITGSTSEQQHALFPSAVQQWLNMLAMHEISVKGLDNSIVQEVPVVDSLAALLEDKKKIGDLPLLLASEEQMLSTISSKFVSQVLASRAITPSHLRFWTIADMILHQAIDQFDQSHRRIAMWITRCTYPIQEGKAEEAKMVRSLHVILGYHANRPLDHIEQEGMFLGIESAEGEVLTTGHPIIYPNLRQADILIPKTPVIDHSSAAICPIVYHGLVAGTLSVVSTHEDYLLIPEHATLVQQYSNVLALVFEDTDFVSPHNIMLSVMPSFEIQKKHLAHFGRQTAEEMIENLNQGKSISNIEVENIIWHRLEEELLALDIQRDRLPVDVLHPLDQSENNDFKTGGIKAIQRYGKRMPTEAILDAHKSGYASFEGGDNSAMEMPNVNHLFTTWLESQQLTRPTPFTPEQITWLERIRNHIATNGKFEEQDFNLSPFSFDGGLTAARFLFGKELSEILRALNAVLLEM
jgi:EcoEI R protein C-terminal